MNELTYERLHSHLARLKLSGMADQLDPLAQQAAKEVWSYLDFFELL
jgi:hypothetical protein